MEKITSILKETLDLVIECSKDQHPYEFAAAMRAENGTITEIIPNIRPTETQYQTQPTHSLYPLSRGVLK